MNSNIVDPSNQILNMQPPVPIETLTEPGIMAFIKNNKYLFLVGLAILIAIIIWLYMKNRKSKTDIDIPNSNFIEEPLKATSAVKLTMVRPT